MATYIALQNFTDQGIRAIQDTTKRAEAVRAMGKRMGTTVKDVYWTMGPYDVVTIFEAADEATATAFVMSIVSAGNVTAQTLRAFTADEADKILGKMTRLT